MAVPLLARLGCVNKLFNGRQSCAKSMALSADIPNPKMVTNCHGAEAVSWRGLLNLFAFMAQSLLEPP